MAALGGAEAIHAIAPPAGGALSRTFHARDLFAPAAARLAGGEAIESLGPRRDSMVELDLPHPTATAAGADGEVIHVDRFGNLLTNLDRAALAAFRDQPLSVRVAGMFVPLRATYGEVAAGEPVAVWSSWETIEIAMRDGDAAARLGVGVGAPVTAIAG